MIFIKNLFRSNTADGLKSDLTKPFLHISFYSPTFTVKTVRKKSHRFFFGKKKEQHAV